ncbi:MULTISPECIES: sensor histidine kinase [Streptomyces]|uniref:histidine kinase n=1 Tax=Streptomyces clavifer TaxID=68188 RepID=A0ABS4V893_9ACTN|nr:MULTISPECIES: HAMP domain-containing sensor histidine kinase [Streptomyces]MBP2360026.1 two-component system sensor histidine kinase MprB [Streptomyces clavifer]MDX2747786.1 HAMP domain-containing sensor histidine kinase [Streptomyces sp. NRRL_B-2557]MDX3064093.1 HAMP domain-containing sensor histidine kinase [Streptomyces sp. ND04-05B]RPK79329.1 Signal transduction histidine-protein kinase/phosphatase MprB [Streptomyces sp. ADI97-07]WRY83350.1 HAMP domain-containing histidine kinase [Strep
MTGPLRRLRALPIRSRLALLVATAVAVAVAAVAVACWFVTREQLENQLDETLSGSKVDERYLTSLYAYCKGDTSQTPPSFAGLTVQLIDSRGTVCIAPDAASWKLPVSGEDLEVAKQERHYALHSATAENGTDMRVYTYPLDVRSPGSEPGNLAVTIARPMSEITDSLSTLAWVLLLVSGIGVVGAGAAGLWVARTGLRPVDELTDAVEHVARTEDLTVRIPVEGEDEIARLSRSFNSMAGSLATSRDRQSQLIADAGHELRTPLTSLRTNIELLVRSDETGRAIPPDDRRALMASVKAQMTELAALIGDLQELSRPDAAQPGPLQVVALHDITRTALQRARLRGPELTITAELAPWYVRAEPAALERAVVNVLDNAVKFSPPGGTVEVVLHRGELTVRDHGPGIPAEELPHVFERFWRSPSARQLPGSGLGLSIVARTVQQAGGDIALRPASGGGGTVASIRLPGAPTPPPEL